MGFHQRIEGVKEFFLGAVFTAEKLDVVNQQQIQGVVVALEVVERLVLIGSNHIGNILFGVDITDLALRRMRAQMIADGVNHMCFAKADTTIDKQRVIGCPRFFGDLPGGSAGQIIGFAGNKSVKREIGIQSRNIANRCGTGSGRFGRGNRGEGECCRGAIRNDQFHAGRRAKALPGEIENPVLKTITDPALHEAVGCDDGYQRPVNRALQRLDPGDKLLLPELFCKKGETMLPEIVHSSL